MKKGIIYNVIKNRKITLFIAATFFIMGLFSYYITPKQEAPKIELPFGMITAIYPGVSPDIMEQLVTSKIEEKLTGVSGYGYSISYSRSGISHVVFEFDYNIDVDKTWQELRNKMDNLQKQLPNGCEIIDINTDLMKTAGVIIGITGENYSNDELYEFAKDAKHQLERVNGMSKFDVLGYQNKQVTIETDTEKLLNYSLSLSEISDMIYARNTEIPLGKINDGDSKTSVSPEAKYSSLEDIKNTTISVKPTGDILKMKDIAKVTLDIKENSSKIKHNNKESLLLAGYFNENENAVIVGKSVKKEIEEIKENMPSDLNLELIVFQPDDIDDSLNQFFLSLFLGILLVFIISFFSMGIRNSIIISSAIPLTILITFSAMNLLGIKFHQVSIAVLIIALGMLVDNAIIVTDSIQLCIDKGMEQLEACIKGTKKVALPVLTSTLTTLVAFFPLGMIKSPVGEYILSIPQVIILSLSFSYLVAIMFTPVLSFVLLKKTNKTLKSSRIKKFFITILNWSLNNKGKTILLTLITVSASLIVLSNLGLQFFPKADKDIIYINVNSEISSDINKTEQLTNEVSRILSEQPEVYSYTVSIGDGIPKFWDTMPVSYAAPEFSQILVRLVLDEGGRFKTNGEFSEYLQNIFDDSISYGKATVNELEQGEPVGAPITLRLLGDDIEKLGEKAKEIREVLENIEGTINVRDDSIMKDYEYRLNIDSDKASLFGIPNLAIQNEINIALRGKTASVYRDNSEEYDIVVKGNINSKKELENIGIKSHSTGEMIKVKQLSQINSKPYLPTIQKYDDEFNVNIFADLRPEYTSLDIQNQLKEKIKDLDLSGLRVTFSGEQESIASNFGNVGFVSIFAILAIFLVLLIQFKSFLQPIIILLALPLSAIGSILGLFVFNQPLSFTGLLGIVSLFGIVVNNAIVLVEFINRERLNGNSIDSACKNSVSKRFRPIFLSTTTTILGLMPLIFLGSELFTPMSIAIVSGLFLSTILTLVIIPVIYSIIERIKLSNKKISKS